MTTNKVEEQFKDHIATLKDYGDIKILDFQNPDTSNWRIRFLFEEDTYTLHISGDLGELDAWNPTNMTYEEFNDFTSNIRYFEEKITAHSRDLYEYDEDLAREELTELIEENGYREEILSKNEYDWETDEEKIDDWLDGVLEYFDEKRGISAKGFEVADEVITDFFEQAGSIGIKSTGILDVYMIAFRLAKKQLAERERRKNEFS